MGTAKAKDFFMSFLKDRGLRSTAQRKDIVDAFFSLGRHITVDELYAALKKKSPHIGYATVHRNLKLLCECGLADEIKVGSNKTRYESKYGHEHHDHLICLKCGRFIEVHDGRIEKLQDNLAEANNFLPQRHKLEIYGICKKCR